MASDRETEDDFDPADICAVGSGWAADGAERDWAEAMFSAISDKSISTQKLGYSHFDETWLLIYDNWSLPMLDVPHAMQHLLQKLSSLRPTTMFKYVFIEHRQSFLRVSAPNFEARVLNDLWKRHT